jgi:prepilin-type N-terminal cleavage/methylation domain-containing protein
MKKAFTLIELVFVIIVIGILSSIAMSSFNRPTLIEAANQVVSHLRYTQHLAMMDNKFDPNDPNWFKSRWQLFFAKTDGSDKQWAYTIFSDHAGSHTGTPDKIEIAKNILNTKQFMTGGYSAGTVAYKVSGSVNPEVTVSMNLGHKYNIKDIEFRGGCRSGVVRRIAYDHIGRLLYGNSRYLNTPYNGTSSPAGSHLVANQCRIELCSVLDCNIANDDEIITIAIEPETGYTHIL